MPKSPKCLLIGSIETYSGKSATVLGLSHQLQQKGLDLAYGKPLGTYLQAYAPETADSSVDGDVQFIAENLHLKPDRIAPTLLTLDEKTVLKRLRGEDTTDYRSSLTKYLLLPDVDLLFLEGPGTLDEGSLFNLSLPEIAEQLDAQVLLVGRYKSVLAVNGLISAQQRLGSRLLGIVLNDVPASQLEVVNSSLRPFLEQHSIPVLGILPSSNLLRSVSVGELVSQLQAQVLCRSDRLDLMVESLAIGAMNVNAAVKYFRKRHNMAVVTGGDRVEIQQAALETSTQCLILTGQLPPPAFILNRAEELEIPILSVDLDTLTTVEIIDRTFGQVRVNKAIKVHCIRQLMAEHFDIERLLSLLGC